MKTSIWLSGLSLMVSGLFSVSVHAQGDYIVHEWGTFTSVQGGDGELLSWRPLQTSELPAFVYNWNRPGLNRLHVGPSTGSKVAMVTLQRMETPVIYFYSSYDMNVDVSVDFPRGLITEWYPQATQIGPSRPLDPNIHTAATLVQSRAVWRNLRLLAPKMDYTVDAARLPQDKSGSHYFAARETGSDLVQMDYAGLTNSVTEYDKFIFYRGAGSFKTPLRVKVDATDAVTAANTGTDDLVHLFLVSVHDNGGGKTAAFTVLKTVAPGASIVCPELHPANFVPLDKFQAEISDQMRAALIDAGLFKSEAAAMVNTWKDSWFSEEGDRVLYILPRAWTDETLPLTLDPKPMKLVRVMVGRAEIITPKAASELSGNLTRAAKGDQPAHELAAHQLRAFGRFAEPALRLASPPDNSNNALSVGYQILSGTPQPSGLVSSKPE